MKEEAQAALVIRFESFEVNLRSRELWKEGQKVKLPEQSFQILAILLERPGEVVLRREIQKRLWPNDTVVEFENSINAAIKKLRLALGDSADQPRYIETLARRGYRWMVPVEWAEANSLGLRVPAGNALSPPPALAAASLIGKRVSHYRVLEVLGGGGMGVVHKAEDLKLGRRVALKFLPEELAGDAAALQRFEREARAASALEHPNICPVYEFGEHEGQPFIAMQLLEGQTLRELIATPFTPGPSPQGREPVPSVARERTEGAGEWSRGTALPIARVLDLAIQIADGLEAAHSKGIIHRDIKPANIFITTRGDVKILDFGLAKLAVGAGLAPPLAGAQQAEPLQEAPRAPAADLNMSKTGVAMGTAPYMSPEQVRGEKLDTRTDLFSFGLVLYEMATGHVAFAGNTAAEVQDAILNRSPVNMSDLNSRIPPRLEGIITKALEKKREARYQAAAEMRFELERLRSEASSRPTGSRRKRALLIALASAAALLVTVVVALAWLFPVRRSSYSARPLRIAPFTGLQGLEDQPAFSPDGRQLAYTWDGGNVTTRAQAAPHPPGHIYVKLIGAGAPLQLTHDARFDQDPAWSPDGRYIAFIRNGDPSDPKSMSQVMSVPALGGPERLLAENDWPTQPGGRGLTWSPDGKSIVINAASESGLFVVSTENGEKRRLTSPQKEPGGNAWDIDPAFSPDGRALAFVRQTGLYTGEVYLQDLKTGLLRRLTFEKADIWGLAWTPDGRDLVFSSKHSGFATLLKVPVSGGEVEPLVGVGGNAFLPAVSRHGDLLAYTNQETNINIWEMAVGPSGSPDGSARRVISGTGAQADCEISPDGNRVVFTSDRSGDVEIWVADIDGSNPLQLTALHAPMAGAPRWSPDGRWIVFGAMVGEQGGAFVVSAQGGTPRRLTPAGVYALVFAWSRDGKSVYFYGNPGGKWGIWKMPAEGGNAVRVADGYESRESDDGRWLYFSRPSGSPEKKTAIYRMPVGGGPETLIFNGVTDRFWTLVGQDLYFLDVDGKLHANINRLDLATRRITRVADVEKQPFVLQGAGALSVSPDGRRIIYPQVDEQVSRIMLVENFRW